MPDWIGLREYAVPFMMLFQGGGVVDRQPICRAKLDEETTVEAVKFVQHPQILEMLRIETIRIIGQELEET